MKINKKAPRILTAVGCNILLVLATIWLFRHFVAQFTASRATLTIFSLPFVLLIHPVLSCAAAARLFPPENDQDTIRLVMQGVVLCAVVGTLLFQFALPGIREAAIAFQQVG